MVDTAKKAKRVMRVSKKISFITSDAYDKRLRFYGDQVLHKQGGQIIFEGDVNITAVEVIHHVDDKSFSFFNYNTYDIQRIINTLKLDIKKAMAKNKKSRRRDDGSPDLKLDRL